MSRLFTFLFISIVSISAISCKDESKSKETEELENKVSVDSVTPAYQERNDIPLENQKVAHVMSRLMTIPETKDFARYGVTTGLIERVSNENDFFLIFAPSNMAFGELTPEERKVYTDHKNKVGLEKLLNSHIVSISNGDEDLVQNLGNNESEGLRTVAGTNITISKVGEDIFVSDGNGNKAKVLRKGIPATNGIIYVIDKVLD